MMTMISPVGGVACNIFLSAFYVNSSAMALLNATDPVLLPSLSTSLHFHTHRVIICDITLRCTFPAMRARLCVHSRIVRGASFEGHRLLNKNARSCWGLQSVYLERFRNLNALGSFGGFTVGTAFAKHFLANCKGANAPQASAVVNSGIFYLRAVPTEIRSHLGSLGGGLGCHTCEPECRINLKCVVYNTVTTAA